LAASDVGAYTVGSASFSLNCQFTGFDLEQSTDSGSTWGALSGQNPYAGQYYVKISRTGTGGINTASRTGLFSASDSLTVTYSSCTWASGSNWCYFIISGTLAARTSAYVITRTASTVVTASGSASTADLQIGYALLSGAVATDTASDYSVCGSAAITITLTTPAGTWSSVPALSTLYSGTAGLVTVAMETTVSGTTTYAYTVTKDDTDVGSYTLLAVADIGGVTMTTAGGATSFNVALTCVFTAFAIEKSTDSGANWGAVTASNPSDAQYRITLTRTGTGGILGTGASLFTVTSPFTISGNPSCTSGVCTVALSGTPPPKSTTYDATPTGGATGVSTDITTASVSIGHFITGTTITLRDADICG
jgi:hypothetical protein